MEEGDGLPNLICVQCVLQCSRAFTFKQLCEKSEAILRQYVSPEFQAELTQSAATSLVKTELQEQLQFAVNVHEVMETEEDPLPGDFSYTEENVGQSKDGAVYLT